MPQFTHIDIRDKLKCQTPTLYGTLYPRDLQAAKDVQAIEDQESLNFAFSRIDPTTGMDRALVSRLAARQIAVVMWDDGTFDERRVTLIDDGHGVGGVINVTANPLLLDMSEGADSASGKGFVSAMSNCNRVFNFAASGSATTILSTYVIPACPSWITLGTVDPTALIPSLAWNRLTPLALALQIRDTLRTMNVGCELQLRRNGATDYKLDLVTQIGSGASVPIFHPRTSLRSLKRRVDTQPQASRLFSVGQSDPTGNPGISGSARWLVTAVDTGLKTLTLADPNSGSGPIGFTDQFAIPANMYLVRCKTMGSVPITVCDPVTQKVTVTSVSTIVAGEFVMIRYSEPHTNTLVRANPNPRFAVTSVGGAAEYVICSGNPITVNDQHVDWYAEVWTAAVGGTVRMVIKITTTDAATDKISCATGAAAGVLLTDYVDFIQIDGAGEMPSYLQHPQSLATYGMKAGDLTVGTATGVVNIIQNPWTRAWTTPANPPDGWAVLGGAGSQNTNPLFLRYGPTSYHYGGGVLTSPIGYPALCVGNSRLSCRLQIYFDSFTGAGTSFEFDVCSAAADGSAGTLLGSLTVLSLNFVTPPPQYKQVPENAWITLEIPGFDLAMDKAPYGIVMTARATGGSFSAYFGAFEAYQFATNPTGVFEFGDSTVIHQATNAKLTTNGYPVVSYDCAISDLERQDPATWSRNLLVKGGNVRAYDSDIGVDTTVRLLRIERDLLRPTESTVQLSNLPKLLTQVAVVTT